MGSKNLVERIDRLESRDATRQLPAKYALALKMRDMEATVSLSPEDVRVGRNDCGRLALKSCRDAMLRSPFTPASSHIGDHVIDFIDSDHAAGIVTSKNEQETGDEWAVKQKMYADDDVRADGRGCFARRLPQYRYATDLDKPPIGPDKMRGPGTETCKGNFRKLFPSLEKYWSRMGDHGGPVADPAPFDKFLETMRRGHAAPRVEVRAARPLAGPDAAVDTCLPSQRMTGGRRVRAEHGYRP
jgi:hypothetical protein